MAPNCIAATRQFDSLAELERRKLAVQIADLKRIQFSTDNLPEHDRIETVCEIYGRTIIKHDIEPIGDGPFRFEADLYGVPGFGLAAVTIGACRAPRRLEHLDSDDLVLNVSLSGGRTVQQRGREALVAEGEAILTTCADPGMVTIPSMSHLFSVRLPQRTLRPALVDFDACLLRPIRRASPALRLLTEYVHAIRNTEALAAPVLRNPIITHIHDLVALILGPEREAGQIAAERGVRAARQAAVLHAIESRSGDPGLNAFTVAAELGITGRYVRLLLEETGLTFSEHVLEKRLTRAFALLRDPRQRARKISELALEAGFSDLSYFNRAFRRRYGATPSDIRASATDYQE